MEPRALMSTNPTPFKEQKDKDGSDLDKTQRALTELSINKGISPFRIHVNWRFK